MTEQVNIELGDVVCVSTGVHARIICVDYFDEKDNQQTLGGAVIGVFRTRKVHARARMGIQATS
jgi:hypothetical protein